MRPPPKHRRSTRDKADEGTSLSADKRISRRTYLTTRAMLDGHPMILATEAVATTAIEHPEWDMDEVRTWNEWEGQ